MTSLIINQIPDELYAMLKQSAHLHQRSVNSELIHCLESTLMPVPLSASQLAEAAQTLRSRVTGPVLTEAEISQARSQRRE